MSCDLLYNVRSKMIEGEPRITSALFTVKKMKATSNVFQNKLSKTGEGPVISVRSLPRELSSF